VQKLRAKMGELVMQRFAEFLEERRVRETIEKALATGLIEAPVASEND
jgi:hypothetical protein